MFFLECPKYIQSFVSISKILITLIKMIVPIALIVFGAADLFKAVSGKNEDDMKKATSSFLKRIIAAGIVFFVFPFIIFITKAVAPDNKYVKDFTYCYENETGWNTDGGGTTIIERPDHIIDDNNDDNDDDEEKPITEAITGRSFTKEEFSSQNGKIRYMLYIPQYAKKVGKLPLIIFLHGSGEKGTDLGKVLQGSSLGKILNKGIDFNAIIAIPQTNDAWNGKQKILKDLIDYISSNYDVNKNKISLTGHSLGGSGTWYMAKAYPELFSCVVPVSALPNLNYTDIEFTKVKIKSYVGSEDSWAKPNEQKNVMQKINENGGNAEVVVLDGKGHTITDEVYETLGAINWMIEQTAKN